MDADKKKLPKHINVERGQTQKNVNKLVLEEFINRYDSDASLKLLDLPCGNQEFLGYLRTLFPNADLIGADIAEPRPIKRDDLGFIKGDLSKEFPALPEESFDAVTSISGVMMFGNTQSLIVNCARILKKGGTFVITNDNSATIKDRLSYLLLGRYRLFGQIFEDHETLTQLVLIQELTRLMRINGIEIEKVEYTSFYPKDLIVLPIALLVYPLQLLYLSTRKSDLPKKLIYSKYTFSQLFNRHYIIVGKKK